MNGASVVPVVVDSIAAATSSAPVEPTPAQVARFEQQLYAAPAAGPGTDFHAVVDYVGEASTRLRFNLEARIPELDLQGLPPQMEQELRLQQQINEGMRNVGNATLEFELIGKSVELVENMPKVLYQQG